MPTQSSKAQVRQDYKPYITDKVAKAETEARPRSKQQDTAIPARYDTYLRGARGTNLRRFHA